MHTYVQCTCTYLELCLPHKNAVVVSAVEVGLPLDHSVVLAMSLVELNPNPLPRSKTSRTYKPEGRCMCGIQLYNTLAVVHSEHERDNNFRSGITCSIPSNSALWDSQI